MPNTVEQDKADLRRLLAGNGDRPSIDVDDREFSSLALMRLVLHSRQAQLGRMRDAGEITGERYLELSSESTDAGFRTVRTVLGEERYRTMFGVDDSAGMLPSERRAFVEARAWGRQTAVRDGGRQAPRAG